MTTLEIVLVILLWLIVGLFICYKRNWYSFVGKEDKTFVCSVTVLFTPLSLLMAFIRVFCIKEWDNSTLNDIL